MKWYVVKLVYQVICGEGKHTPQFDEQIRIITAQDEAAAYEKAYATGMPVSLPRQINGIMK